jgi:hypothetical protein
MTDQSLTSGLDPEKLRDLLRICTGKKEEQQPTDSDRKKAELLQDMLAETLPVDAFTGQLSKHLTTLCQTFGISSQQSVRDLLSNPKTDVNLIIVIKDYFKKKPISNKSKDEHDVINTIYYAAITYALVIHNMKITKYSYKELHKAFKIYKNVKWIPRFISDLFTNAYEYCRNKDKD